MAERSRSSNYALSVEAGTATTAYILEPITAFAAAAGLALIEGAPPMDTGILLALAASFISALVSIDLLIKLAQRTRFWKLCVVLGLIALVAVLPYLL